MNKFKKYIKVLVFSILSIITYMLIVDSTIELQIQESKSFKAFGYFIIINIVKWFLLTFGIIGLFFWFYKMFIKKD
jgi:hypothetical protein